MSQKRVTIKLSGVKNIEEDLGEIQQRANSHKITGEAESTDETTIHILAEGEESELHTFTNWLRDLAPFSSYTTVDDDWGSPSDSYSHFRI